MLLSRRISLGCVVLITLLLTSCGGSQSPTGTDTDPPVATTINLSSSDLSFDALGATEQLTATVLDQNGNTMASASVTWTSSEESVATVSSSGLVTAEGNGSADIMAESGTASATSNAVVEQVPATIDLDPTFLLLSLVGDTATVSATVLDGNDQPVDDADVEWSSLDTGTADVSAAGLVTAVADGMTVVTAESGTASGSIDVYVGDANPVITDVSPTVLVEGDVATITGVGFLPPGSTTVTVGGLDAQINSATSTEIEIVVPTADCEPSRSEELVVTTPSNTANQDVDVQPEEVFAIEVGDAVFSTEGCLALAGGSASERYMVGVLSTSETPSSLTPADLGASVGMAPSPPALVRLQSGGSRALSFDITTPTSPALQAASGPDAAPPAAASGGWDLRTRPLNPGEARIRAMERELLARLGPAGRRPALAPGAPSAAPPNEGDTLTMNVPQSCNDAISVEAVVRHVGDAGVWLEDVDNPTESFTTADYEDFDQTLSTNTMPTITDYFGDLGDIDDNDRISILLTKEVNEMGDLNGFVFSVDLYDPSVCSVSNQAEIFYGYVPDPMGTHGRVLTKEDVVGTYHPLIAHEATHIIQQAKIIFEGAALKASWEAEGGATLAEQLVGFEVLGHGPGQDLGQAEHDLGYDNGWYFDWAVDMVYYFGYSDSGKVPNAPEECSWVGRVSEGNDGPCGNALRAPYGVPATLLRYILDTYGGSHAGGEAGLMRELTGSAESGFENIATGTGEQAHVLLTTFAITLWADGRTADLLTSWDIFDVLQRFNADAQLVPYESTDAAPSLSLSVRAGSSAYLDWTPPAAHAPTALRIRDLAGDLLIDDMVLWILRIQ